MVITWTTYYGEDFTRIVLELIGALEQRMVVDAELGYQPSSFPHLFNIPAHQNYVGRIPDIEFYDPDSMMTKIHFQGKCIEIHVGYEKETRGINRCGDE